MAGRSADLRRLPRGGGRFTSGTVIERDLTGNGRNDLILSHEGITCADGTRSIYCGMQVCSVLLYVREGGLLVEKASILGGGVTVSNATPPVISGHGHGGGSWSLRWTGRRFR